MKTDYQNLIINKIRKLRNEKNYSQQKLSIILDISNGQIGNIETPSKDTKYTLRHIYKICKEFNIPIDNIFMEDEDYYDGNDFIDKLIKNIIRYENK